EVPALFYAAHRFAVLLQHCVEPAYFFEFFYILVGADDHVCKFVRSLAECRGDIFYRGLNLCPVYEQGNLPFCAGGHEGYRLSSPAIFMRRVMIPGIENLISAVKASANSSASMSAS